MYKQLALKGYVAQPMMTICNRILQGTTKPLCTAKEPFAVILAKRLLDGIEQRTLYVSSDML